MRSFCSPDAVHACDLRRFAWRHDSTGARTDAMNTFAVDAAQTGR
jgi:hypothetical protein